MQHAWCKIINILARRLPVGKLSTLPVDNECRKPAFKTCNAQFGGVFISPAPPFTPSVLPTTPKMPCCAVHSPLANVSQATICSPATDRSAFSQCPNPGSLICGRSGAQVSRPRRPAPCNSRRSSRPTWTARTGSGAATARGRDG